MAAFAARFVAAASAAAGISAAFGFRAGGVIEGVGRSVGHVFVSPIRAGRAIPKPKIVFYA